MTDSWRGAFFGILIICLISSAFIAESASAFEEDDFFEEETGPDYTLEGELASEFRVFEEDDNKGTASLDLDFTYETANYDLVTLIQADELGEDVVDFQEAYLKLYRNQYEFTLGKKRLVWGKGDKVHVVDHINGEDMTDFLNQDYLDRQLGEEMLKIDRYVASGNGQLEFVYTPGFSGHELATETDGALGDWVINPLSPERTETVINQLGITEDKALELLGGESLDYDDDHQLALRYTRNQRGYDYGFTYYHGRLREPSYDLSGGLKYLDQGGNSPRQFINKLDPHYDKVDVFGAELATVIGNINSRAELAYYRTEDTAGDDPTVRNSRITSIIGGDRDLPISNINLNLQLMSEYILENDAVDDNPLDVDYNEDDDYFTNRIILQLEDSFRNEKIIPELIWVYNYEAGDYSLEGKVDYELKSDLNLELAYKVFSGDADTTFGQFKDNDFGSIKLRYQF